MIGEELKLAGGVTAEPDFQVRRLRADEGPLLRRVRLAAILEAPLGHTVSLNEALAYDDAHWDRRAESAARSVDRSVWIAFGADHPVGIVGGERRAEAIEVDALWVAPGVRGQQGTGHVADQLLRPLMQWAWREQLHTDLWVHETNHRALHYYRRIGFSPTGQVKAYPLPPGGHDVHLRLTRPPTD